MNMNECMSAAIRWAREAGEIQRERFRTALTIDCKSSGIDLVTEVDRQCEKRILDQIHQEFPDCGVLGEETGLYQGDAPWRWVVDPLDGTTNFSQGLPIFCVSIALQKNGQSELGVVYAPMLDQLFTTIRDHGAFLNGQALRVGDKMKLSDSVLGSGFPYDVAKNPDNNAAHFGHFVPKTRGLRRMGAAAYDLAMVASGGLDGYWEFNLSPWDAAAGTLLVTEAGGVIIPLPHKRGVSLVAANRVLAPLIQKELTYVDTYWEGGWVTAPLT